MLSFKKKFSLCCILFFCCPVFYVSSANPSAVSEKNKQLCYFKNNYIHKASYDYRYPYFYPVGNYSESSVSSIVSLTKPIFTKNPWELSGIQANVLPFAKKQSLIHWLKYDINNSEQSLNKLCNGTKRACLFKIVYEGNLYLTASESGPMAVKYRYKNKNLRVSIRDEKDNILKFPKDCPE